MNGTQTELYKVERGLRQGDPLAPMLFNLVLEPFLLYFNLFAEGIETVAGAVKVGSFADDTILGLRPGDEGVALRAIRLHERASGDQGQRGQDRDDPTDSRSEKEVCLSQL